MLSPLRDFIRRPKTPARIVVEMKSAGANQLSEAVENPQGERGSVHQFSVPPKGNSNFTQVQHFIRRFKTEENQYVV